MCFLSPFQAFDTVPRVYGASTYASCPCIDDKKSEDWVLPPCAEKYVKEAVLQEWTNYQSEKSVFDLKDVL